MQIPRNPSTAQPVSKLVRPSGKFTPVRLPTLVWVVLLFTVVAFFGGERIFGYALSGISWVVPFTLALLLLCRNLSSVTFPVRLFLPWVLLLFTYLVVVDYSLIDPRVSPVQRTLQVLAPLVVGMSVSTCRPSQESLVLFVKLLRWLAYLLIGLALYKSVSWIFLPGASGGLAAEMITVLLLCCFFANRYLLFEEKKDLLVWLALAGVPVLMLTRTVVACVLLTFPLAFSPMRMRRRVIILVLIAVVALGIFYSPRVQKKMFFSGQGQLSDILSEDFQTSGRSFMWEKMYDGAMSEMWTGHGTGRGETLAYRMTGKTAYPHNDWLLTYFDYGLLGVGLLIGCIFLTVKNGLKRLRYCRDKNTRFLLLAGISAFIPFVLVMFTDNILVYSSFFGNLHFTILGLAYASLRTQRIS